MQKITDLILSPSNLSHLQSIYVKLLLDVMGRALEAATQLDETMRGEIAVLKPGFIFEMSVMPSGPGIVMQKQQDGSMRYLGGAAFSKPDLRIQIKHMAHAFLLLSFQESTASAFANDRMVMDGDISLALKIVRCLNRLESFILPKAIAKRAVKRYPSITLREKTFLGALIYVRLAANFAKRVINV